jgi:hypothetical protein
VEELAEKYGLDIPSEAQNGGQEPQDITDGQAIRPCCGENNFSVQKGEV